VVSPVGVAFGESRGGAEAATSTVESKAMRNMGWSSDFYVASSALLPERWLTGLLRQRESARRPRFGTNITRH
jgi:hypothetical protein